MINEDRFERVQISRNRVHGGLAAIAMGLLAATLALDLLFLALGSITYYDAAWYTCLIGTVALAAAIGPGIMAWIEEGRRTVGYMTRDDDGRAVVLATAVMVGIVDLVLRLNHGAIVGPELGTAVVLSIATLGLMAFAGPIGDWLADRFPSSRRTASMTAGEDLVRERETTLRR